MGFINFVLNFLNRVKNYIMFKQWFLLPLNGTMIVVIES